MPTYLRQEPGLGWSDIVVIYNSDHGFGFHTNLSPTT